MSGEEDDPSPVPPTLDIGNPAILIISETIKQGMESFAKQQSTVLQEGLSSILTLFQKTMGDGKSGGGRSPTGDSPLRSTRARTFSEVAHDGSAGSSTHSRPKKLLRREKTTASATKIHDVPPAANAGESGDGGEPPNNDDELSLLGSGEENFEQVSAKVPPASEVSPCPSQNTLDLATVDFLKEEAVGPPVSQEIALKLEMMTTTPLPPEKLKLRLDREVCPSNVKIFTKRVNESLFNRRGGAMGSVRNADLELQSIQKMINKAMLPLVTLTDHMHLAEIGAA